MYIAFGKYCYHSVNQGTNLLHLHLTISEQILAHQFYRGKSVFVNWKGVHLQPPSSPKQES